MSKQEILSWTSLATSTSVVVFYVLIIFGLPESLPDYSGQLFSIFFKVFLVAVVIEMVVEIMSKKKRVDKDERDFMIEAYGHRYAYTFLVIALAIVLVNLFLSGIFGEYSEIHAMIGSKRVIFHTLFFILYIASIIKRMTMIYHYRTAF